MQFTGFQGWHASKQRLSLVKGCMEEQTWRSGLQKPASSKLLRYVHAAPRSALKVSSSRFHSTMGLSPTYSATYLSMSGSSTVEALTHMYMSAFAAASPGLATALSLLPKILLRPPMKPFLPSFKYPMVSSPSDKSRLGLNLQHPCRYDGLALHN